MTACVYASARVDERARTELDDIRREVSRLHVVIVTHYTRENAETLAQLSRCHVAWLDRVGVDLPVVLGRLAPASVCALLARRIESEPAIACSPVGRTMLVTLNAAARVPSQQAMARSARRSERSVARDLNRVFAVSSVGMRWKRAVRTAIARDLNHGGRLPPEEACRLLGIDLRTLCTSIRQSADVTYKQLRGLSPDEVYCRITAYLGLDSRIDDSAI